MTTKAELITECESDLARSSVDDDISKEIDRAITFYRDVPFWFSEGRDTTFDTVAGQASYPELSTVGLADVVDLGSIAIEDVSTSYSLTPISIEAWEALQDTSASGRPYWFVRFGRALYLYPTPNAVVTLRLTGHVQRAGPLTDAETGNVWMTEGFELIRARTVRNIAAKKDQDYELASVWQMAEKEELDRLRRESSRRMGTGTITPTSF